MSDKKYKIGVSSGFLIPGQNNVFSLTQKLTNVITWGVNYTQVDIQSTSEISKRDFLPGIKHVVEALKMRYGMHAEIDTLVGMDWAASQIWDPCHLKINEYMDLLYDFFYYDENGNPVRYTKDSFEEKVGRYLPEYIDFHISLTQAIPPRSTLNEIINAPCTTPWGKGNWTVLFDSNPHLKKWFMINIAKLLYERQAAMHQAYDILKKNWKNDWLGESSGNAMRDMLMGTPKERIAALELEKHGIRNDPNIPQADKQRAIAQRDAQIHAEKEKIKEEERLDDAIRYFEKEAAGDFEDKGKVESKYEDLLFSEKDGKRGFLVELYDEWKQTTRRQNYEGTIIGEQYAYAIIAKYIEFQHAKKDGMDRKGRHHGILWDNFVLRKDNFLEQTDGEEIRKRKVKIESDGTLLLHPDIVAMVASCYIIGHWETSVKDTDEYFQYRDYLTRKGIKYNPTFHDLRPIDKLNLLGTNIAFENPHLLDDKRPGTQRIVKAIDMEKFARSSEAIFKEKNRLFLLCDFGWWQANGMDPVSQIEKTSERFGEYVKAIQIHYAYATGSAHFTIDIGSPTHERMYTWLYLLRKKGMVGVPIVFERGGGQNPLEVVRTSVFSMRTMVENLQRANGPVKPEEWGPEFYGFSPESIFSPDRQRVVMREHWSDPLKGMLEVKEFEHGFLGGHAIGKGKRPDELARERFK